MAQELNRCNSVLLARAVQKSLNGWIGSCIIPIMVVLNRRLIFERSFKMKTISVRLKMLRVRLYIQCKLFPRSLIDNVMGVVVLNNMGGVAIF